MRIAQGALLVVLLAGCSDMTWPASPASNEAATRAPRLSPVASPRPTATPSIESPAALPADPPPEPTMAPASSHVPYHWPTGTHVAVMEDDLRVRSAPGVGPASIRYVPTLKAGTEVIVVGGPHLADGYWWYLIELAQGTLNGGIRRGWVAGADHDGTEWLHEPECGFPPASITPGDMIC